MTATSTLLSPGSLWASVVARSEHALHCGALLPLATEYGFIEQAGIRFLVRVLANLARKDAVAPVARRTEAGEFNPFLPYEADLFVTDLSASHLCLLNKFNVLDHHLLIVTRAFVAQETLLDLADFTALALGLAEIDGLGFYNAGRVAGASQRHKHLQLVPLPLAPAGPRLPVEPLLATARYQAGIGRVPALPFQHALIRWAPSSFTITLVATALLDAYQAALDTLALPRQEATTTPYNLLITRDWLLLVPRRQERWEDLSVNALGFAGALLVRDIAQRERLRAAGPLTVLTRVAWPPGLHHPPPDEPIT
jgi:ATP adenylyltransferase